MEGAIPPTDKTSGRRWFVDCVKDRAPYVNCLINNLVLYLISWSTTYQEIDKVFPGTNGMSFIKFNRPGIPETPVDEVCNSSPQPKIIWNESLIRRPT